jgi:hypothetical protein
VFLDHLDKVGTDKVMGAVVERYLARPDRPKEWSVRTDTTSFTLYGAYLDMGEPVVTHGFSKDHRPERTGRISDVPCSDRSLSPAVRRDRSSPAGVHGH